MKIALNIGATSFRCREPHPGAECIEVADASCPACHDLIGLVDERGILRALARHDIAKARKETEANFGPCSLQDAPGASGAAFRIRGISPTEYYGHVEAPAECCRCRSVVGVLRVDFATMWGSDEDRRVLHGRCRVY